MFVLRDKTTKQYVRKNVAWSEAKGEWSRLTNKLGEARVFRRKEDYKQSVPWTGGHQYIPGKGYVQKYNDESRPVEAVRVILVAIENPFVQDVEIKVS